MDPAKLISGQIFQPGRNFRRTALSAEARKDAAAEVKTTSARVLCWPSNPKLCRGRRKHFTKRAERPDRPRRQDDDR